MRNLEVAIFLAVTCRLFQRSPHISWIALFMILAGAADARDAKSGNQECAMCHIMWLNDFKRPDSQTLIPYAPQQDTQTGKQDASSTESMCFSCHDGFVLDSRFLWENRHYSHPVGVIPSDEVSIPTTDGKTIFPLNDEGKLYCGTCHSAHGVSWDRTDSPVFLRMPNIESGICLACHLNRSSGPREGNHPTDLAVEPTQALTGRGAKFGRENRMICQTCHRMHGAHDSPLLVIENKNSSLCTTCHSAYIAADKLSALKKGTHPVGVASDSAAVSNKLLEAGAHTGEGKTVICQTCHRPHRAQGKKLLLTRNSDSELCASCHADHLPGASHSSTHPVGVNSDTVRVPDTLTRKGARLGSKNRVICETCHKPHNALGSEHLLVSTNRNSALCISCHTQQQGIMVSAHNLAAFPNQTVNIKDQPPLDGPCSVCHVAHGGEGPYMWARIRSSPTKGDGVSSACTDCHSAGGLAQLALVGDRTHPVGVQLTASHSNINGLTTKHGGKVVCASCHDPHLADSEANNFLRFDSANPSSYCLNCHKDKSVLTGTDHDIINPDSGQRDTCLACHKVHNALGPALWGREPGDGQDQAERQCRSCHSPEGLAADKVPPHLEHPPRQMANGGSGQPPLLDADGNQGRFGVISCPTCHDPHRWSFQDHQPNSNVGDVMSSFLRQSGTAATLCSNCHGSQGLSLYKDFHYMRPARR